MSIASILGFLGDLAPELNPFTELRKEFKSIVLPVASNVFIIQVYILAALLIVIILASITTLYLICRKGNIWFFRLVYQGDTNKIPYIQPHGTIVWLTMLVIFESCCFAIAVKLQQDAFGILEYDLVSWCSFSWIPLFLSEWFVLWTTGVAYIIQRNRNNRDRYPIIKFLFQPFIVNAVAIIVPFSYLITAFYLGYVTSQDFQREVGLYVSLDSQLAAEELLVDNGKIFSLLDLVPLSDTLNSLGLEAEEFSMYFHKLYLMQAQFTIFLLFSLLIFTVLLLHSIRRTIKLADKVRKEINNSSEYCIVQTTKDRYSNLRKTYYKMLFMLGSLLVVGVAETAGSLNVAIQYKYLISSKNDARNDLLIALYLFVVPIFPLIMLLLWRAYDQTPGNLPSYSEDSEESQKSSKVTDEEDGMVDLKTILNDEN